MQAQVAIPSRPINGRYDPGRRWPLLSILVISALLQLVVLAPLTDGHDFQVYSRLSRLVLEGHDVYAPHDPALIGLPWAYFPLYLHVFTALQWVALHAGWSFRVLGKLPTIIADLDIGVLLYLALRTRGHGERRALLGMSLYLFNPLILFSDAHYGRFDAVALAFLLAALESYNTWLFAPAYALAIAAKTFPLFLLPVLAFGRDRQAPRRLAMALALVPLLALPTLLTDPAGLLANVLYHLHGSIDYGRLSWYIALIQSGFSAAFVATLAQVFFLLFPVTLLLLLDRPLYSKVAGCFLLFIVFEHPIFEQYLTWPMPFLILVALHERRQGALWLLAFLTFAGLTENERTWAPHVFEHYYILPTPCGLLNAALAYAVIRFLDLKLQLRVRQLWTAARPLLNAARS